MKSTVAAALLALLLVVVPSKPIVAQQGTVSDEAIALLSGEWFGTIQVTQTLGQDVLWRFERSSSGEVVGFMGPAAMGRAMIPMQDISSDATELSFRVDSQNGRFVGAITGGQVTGTWRQGQVGPVIFTRSELAAAGDPNADSGSSASVLGLWEARRAEDPAGSTPRSYIRFERNESGALTGRTGDALQDLTTPLDGIVLTGSDLTFLVPAEAPYVRRVAGTVSEGTIVGESFQGIESALAMRKDLPRE